MDSVVVNGLEIAYLSDGPPEGQPVVMQHGFPDGPWTFDGLADRAAEAGFHVVRPFLRGYPPTQIPAGRTVAVPDLVADLNGLPAALGLTDPVLIGHDWGAVIGWQATTGAANPWAAYVALAIPPPPILARVVRDPAQVFYRSAYMWPMQVPGFERVLPHLVAPLYRRWSHRWSPPEEHLDKIRAMFSNPDAARAAVGYYRWMVPAVLTGRFPPDRHAVPDIPVCYLHGAHDRIFTARDAERALVHLPFGSVEVVPDCGHFLHLEQPQAVADRVLAFLRSVA